MILRGAWAAAALAACAAGAVAAETGVDYVETEGKLATADFYRLVSCRAEPGGPCAVEPVAWPPEMAPHLTVAVGEAPPGFPRDLAHRIGRAVDAAVAEINAAGAGLHLGPAPEGADADVTIRLTASREGEPIAGTGIPGVDGEEIGAALVTVWWDDRLALTDAVIVLASDLRPADVASVVLEELTQAMGLMTDIRNPYYEGLSVFSEDSNAATRLGPQDVEALRLHYPPGEP